MKRLFVINGIVLTAFLLTGFLTADRSVFNPEPSGFLILVQNTHDGLKLHCEKGCAWKELSFTLKENKSQAIDQNGMTDQSTGKNFSGFLFLVQRTETAINLEGKKGTAWTMLSFSCPVNKCNQYVDQNGTVAN